VRLGKQPVSAARVNQLRGTVWELGYLGNHSIYQIKTATGKLVTVFAQNERPLRKRPSTGAMRCS